jgi:putative ABC transport system permease protein
MIRVGLKGLAARPMRTALTALAIVLGVATITAAFTISDTMRGGADALSSASYDGTDAVVSTRTAFKAETSDWTLERPTIDAGVAERLREVPEVAVATGDITDEAKIVGSDGKPVGDGPYFGVGYDSTRPGADRTTPFRLDEGRWATGPGQVVLDAATAEKQDLAIGDRVRITTREQAATYEITGVARFGTVKSLGTATAAIFDLGTAQQLFHKDGAYDSILVAGREGVAPADVRKAVAAVLPQTAQMQTAAAHDRFTLDGLESFISIIRTTLLIFGGVAIAVGAFTILNALSITVAQRTRELGLLRMVGAGRAQVLRMVLVEAFMIGLLASVVGLGVGYGLALGLGSLLDSMGLDLPDAGTVFATRTIVVSLLVGTLVTMAAGLIPAWRATRVAPVAALRGASEASHKLHLPGRVLRSLTGLLGVPAQRLGGSAGMLARRNATRHPGRTTATAAALMIGVALVTTVTVIAAGLKDTTSGSLERRVSAEYIVTGHDGWSPTDPAVAQAISKAPGVETVSGIKQDTALAFGDKETINAVDPKTIGEVFAFDWAEGDDSVLSGLDRQGAIVDEGWAKEHGLAVGERFSVKSAKGEDVALVVRGIEKSPIIDVMGLGPVTISQPAFDGAFAAELNMYTFVAASSPAGIEQALKQFPDTKSLSKGAYIDQLMTDIDTLLAVFYVLLALAVIVSLFGIVNTLVLSTFERTRELGMLRAVGMTRRQVRRMVRHESIITALLGAGLGMALGLGLAAIVTSVFSEEGLTFVLPAGSLVAFTVVAVIAGVLAAILPARRAARLNVLSALAWE